MADSTSATVALLSILDMLARFVLGFAVFCHTLPPRDGRRRRVAVVLALAAAALVVALVPPYAGSGRGQIGIDLTSVHLDGRVAAAELALFSALLLAGVAGVRYLFEASTWTALFCCSAGYAVQNLASGATELAWILARGSVLSAGVARVQPFGAYRLLTWAFTLCAYLVTYRIVARRITAHGLALVSDRSMVVMMAVTILAIIGFDLVIKGLCDDGIRLGAAVALRLVHGLVCVFVVWMEYELLVNRALDAENAASQRLLAERQRQYERGRRNMDALNRRVHDIRHAVMRTLRDAGSNVDRATSAQLMREIDVYDSAVRSGNEALDTALSEKRLLCLSKDIDLSVVADGHALDGVAPADAYALVGAALDAAIDAADAMPQGRRTISVVVRRAMGAASVHAECYCASSHSHLDATTTHVTPMLRALAEKYDGTATMLVRDGRLHVNVILPERET